MFIIQVGLNLSEQNKKMKYQAIRELIAENVRSVFEEQKMKFSLFNAYNFQIEKKIGTTIGTVYFDKIIVKGGIQYSGGGMGLLFPDVENIVFPLWIKHQMWRESFSMPPEKSPGTMGNYDMSEELINARIKFSTITIANIEDVKRYSKELINFLLDQVLPWFKHYSDLNNVNAMINSMDDIESANWFSSPHMLRKIVIKKLCNDASYETYLKFWKDRFEGIRDLENGRYIPYLNAVLDLEKQLASL
jgi:hypothetical protein